MKDFNLITVFTKKLPHIFSKESITDLITKNKISFIQAKESLAAIDLTSEAYDKDISTDSIVSKMQKLGFYANVKFEAMLESAKEDERMLYDEFVNLDNARNKIISEIVSKKEGDINALLQAIKTLPGVNEKEIDELIGVSVKVEDLK